MRRWCALPQSTRRCRIHPRLKIIICRKWRMCLMRRGN